MRTPKLLTLFVCCVCTMLTSQVYAGSWRINSNSAWNPDFPSINAAMNDDRVVEGDTLYIEQGATFDEVQTISKPVIVLGLGYDANQFNNIVIEAGAESVKLMGLHISGGILLREEGATLERCYVSGLIQSDKDYSCDSTTVRCCFLNFGISSDVDSYTNGWLIENNILSGVGELASLLLYIDGSTIRNNVCYNLYGISGDNNSVTDNIIFWDEGGFSIEGEGNTVEGNMFSNAGSEDYPNNQYGYDNLSAFFRCSGGMTSDAYWFLADNSPAKKYEVGLTYGESPYTTVGTFPYGLPVFQKGNYVPATSENGVLDITLDIQCFQPSYGDYPSAVTLVEYFWDVNPGNQIGTRLLYNGTGATYYNKASLDVSGLEPGTHTLYVRAFAGNAYTLSVHQVEITEVYQWNNGDVFTAQTDEGVEMTFQVISAQDKTCQVGANKSTSISKEYLGNVTIPEKVKGLTVKELGPYAFNECKISLVTIPNTVTTIDWYAFMNCPNLEGITIPASVTSIGQDVFNNSFVPYLRVEEGNSVYDSRHNCNAIIETATNKLLYGGMYTGVPEDVTTIGQRAFYGRTGMQYFDIPNSVTVIENSAFSNSSLSEVSLPNNLQTISGGVFSGCKNLTRLTIPASVTSIGQNIVSNSGVESLVVNGGNEVYDSRDNCNAIIETATNTLVVGCDATTIPGSVKTIGEYAFYMAGFSSIVIPEGVTDIVQKAFNFCQNLESVTLPEGLKNIGTVAFAGSDVLTSITIPSTVTNIAYNAFGSHLTSIYVLAEEPPTADRIISNKYSDVTLYVPAGTKSKYQNANEWKKFTNIEELAPAPTYNDGDVFTAQTIEGVEMTFKVISAKDKTCQVGESDFNKRGVNTSTSGNITIPQFVNGLTVTSISDNAFNNCRRITGIYIPESVTYIGDNSFCYCDDLANVTIPSSVTYIGKSAFNSCDSLRSITLPHAVTIINDRTFEDCYNLRSITIPETITSIGNNAFHLCRNLTNINIPSTVTTIGEYAFNYCESLTSLHIPHSVTTIGNMAFQNCGSLTSITVDSQNTTYDSRDNCNAIILTAKNSLVLGCSNTVIPNTVTSIGQYAFFYAHLTSIIIPSSVVWIESSSFSGCSALTDISMSNSVRSIGAYAFSSCSSLKSITIPSSVYSIGQYAFSGCSSLSSISIPASVTSIGNNPFTGCSGLQNITVDVQNPYYDSRDNCNALIKTTDNILIAGCQNTTIPNSIISINEYAFSGCSILTNIVIPNSVTAIGRNAFSGCSGLTNINIPSSVTTIGAYAFMSCSGLTSITSEIQYPFATGNEAFYGIPSDATLYVPAGTKAQYAALADWNRFTNIEEAGIVDPNTWTIGSTGDFANLNAAMSDERVKDGDVLKILPNSSIPNSTITKAVTIEGNGYSSREDGYCGTMYVNSDGVTIRNLYSYGVVLQGKNLTVERCRMSTIHATDGNSADNATIRGCLIAGYVCGYYKNPAKGWKIYNNIISVSNYTGDALAYLSEATIDHNIIVNFRESLYSGVYAVNKVTQSSLTNNILIRSGNSEGVGSDVINTATKFEYNIHTNTSNPSGWPTNKAGFAYRENEIYVCSGEKYTDSYFVLTANSPAIGYANDGGDCGPWSGSFPYLIDGVEQPENEYVLNSNAAENAQRHTYATLASLFNALQEYRGDADVQVAVSDATYTFTLPTFSLTGNFANYSSAELAAYVKTMAEAYVQILQKTLYFIGNGKNISLTAPLLATFQFSTSGSNNAFAEAAQIIQDSSDDAATKQAAQAALVAYQNDLIARVLEMLRSFMLRLKTTNISILIDGNMERNYDGFSMEPNDLLALRNIYNHLGGASWTKNKWSFANNGHVKDDFPGVTFDGSRVVSIDLENCGLTGELVDKTWNPVLAELTYLNISRNNLTGDLAPFVADMPKLKTLYAHHNRLTEISGPLPASVSSLNVRSQNRIYTGNGTGWETVRSDAAGTRQTVWLSSALELTLPSLSTYTADQNDNSIIPQVFVEYANSPGNFYGWLNLDDNTGYWRFGANSNLVYDLPQDADVWLSPENPISLYSAYPARLRYVPGDANFSGYTDVLDVQWTLNYILTPTKALPFNRSAANTYEDEKVNVQDIVCTVNIVLEDEDETNTNGARRYVRRQTPADDTPIQSWLYTEGGRVKVNTEVPVAALDIELEGMRTDEVSLLLNQNHFQIKGRNTKRGSRFVIFSPDGSTIPADCTTAILALSNNGQLTAIQCANKEAREIVASIGLPTGIDTLDGNGHNSSDTIYDISGRRVEKPRRGLYIQNNKKILK